MTDETELIAAIAATPDDDAPRMVYADWLMQRGDPRGEFIALQCRIARAIAVDEALDRRVIARERELRDEHTAAWLAPLREILEAGYVFRRGFVEHVAVWSERDVAISPDADRLAELARAAPLLRSIAVRAEVLASELGPVWNGLSSVTLTETLPGVANPAITSYLATRASSLRRLHLVNVSLDGEGAIAWLGATQPLEHLGFRMGEYAPNKHGQEIVGLIAANPALHGLRSLDLANLTLKDLRPLAALQQLECLALHHCNVKALDVIELISKLPALHTLELDDDDRKLGRGSPANRVAGLLGAAKLRRLALRSWRVKEGGAEAIASSPRAASLRRLELDRCEIGEPGAHALLGSDHLRDLIWLEVADPKISKETHALIEARRDDYAAPVPAFLPEVVAEWPANKINAIKRYRERTQAGLADSKMACERIGEELGFGANPSGTMYRRATTRWCRP